MHHNHGRGFALAETLICSGCGVPIQTTDPAKPGFVPERALAREEVICQRCFRIRHYNDVAAVALEPEDYRRMLLSIGEKPAVVAMVVDLFDLEGSWIAGVHRILGGQTLLLVANKCDLFPPETNWQRVEQWLYRQAKEQGLAVTGISFVSAEKNSGIDALLERIRQLRRPAENVYLVGTTNVGKSTLMNRLLERLAAEAGDKPEEGLVTKLRTVTTSPYPGTTLDMIAMPLGDGGFFVDTPGLVHERRLIHFLAPEDLRRVVPRRRLRPKIYQLEPGQTLFFGALARLDFKGGARQSFVCYVSNDVSIHRTKLQRADDMYRKHAGELLSPPGREAMQSYPALSRRPLKVRRGQDVAIAGLGWVSVKGEWAELELWAPKEIEVAIRESMY